MHLPRHTTAPDPADLQAVRDWVRADRGRPTALDLFCGAGGLSLGLEQAGFRVLAGADSDPWAVRTHEANIGGLGWTGDLDSPEEFLQTLAVWGIERVDLVAGGVPCQPFSRAGASRMRDLVATGERAGHDARATLWESFMAVVRKLRPAAVLVENVPDLPRWDDGAVLSGIFESLRDCGYRVDARVVEAGGTRCHSTASVCWWSVCLTDAPSIGPRAATGPSPSPMQSMTYRLCPQLSGLSGSGTPMLRGRPFSDPCARTCRSQTSTLSGITSPGT